jgi:hypothetical protein
MFEKEQSGDAFTDAVMLTHNTLSRRLLKAKQFAFNLMPLALKAFAFTIRLCLIVSNFEFLRRFQYFL